MGLEEIFDVRQLRVFSCQLIEISELRNIHPKMCQWTTAKSSAIENTTVQSHLKYYRQSYKGMSSFTELF